MLEDNDDDNNHSEDDDDHALDNETDGPPGSPRCNTSVVGITITLTWLSQQEFDLSACQDIIRHFRTVARVTNEFCEEI